MTLRLEPDELEAGASGWSGRPEKESRTSSMLEQYLGDVVSDEVA